MSLRYMDDFSWIGAADSSLAIQSLGFIDFGVASTILANSVAAGSNKRWLQLTSTHYGRAAATTYNQWQIGFRVQATSTGPLTLTLIGQGTNSFTGSGITIGTLTLGAGSPGVITYANYDGTDIRTFPEHIPWGSEFYVQVSVGLTSANPITFTPFVYINGSPSITFPALSTGQNASAWPSGFYCLGFLMGGSPSNVYVTDWWDTDNQGSAPWNDVLGSEQVFGFFPTANGTVQMTPHGDAANWQNVSQIPNAYASDYNQSGPAAATDTFPLGTNPQGFTMLTVAAVGLRSLAFRPDATAGNVQVYNYLKSASMVTYAAEGSLLAPPSMTEPAFCDVCLTQVPITLAAWTQTEFATINSGYLYASVSGGQVIRYSQTMVFALGTPGNPPSPPPPAPPPVLKQSLGQYRGQVGINVYGKVLMGDAFAGVIGEADFDNFTEYGNTMQALVTTPTLNDDRARLFVDKFEIDVQAGVGLTSGQGSDPQWMMQWSKDGGETWVTLQKWRSMGKIGAYTQRLRWLRLGQARQWIFQLSATDPVRRVILDYYVAMRKGMG